MIYLKIAYNYYIWIITVPKQPLSLGDNHYLEPPLSWILSTLCLDNYFNKLVAIFCNNNHSIQKQPLCLHNYCNKTIGSNYHFVITNIWSNHYLGFRQGTHCNHYFETAAVLDSTKTKQSCLDKDNRILIQQSEVIFKS